MKIRILKKTKRYIFSIFILILIFFLCIIYFKSEQLKIQGDSLIRLNQPAEAIIFYQKALKIFPLRWDIVDDISGAKLILESKNDYESITDFSEIQTSPPLSNLPSKQLEANELFVPILMYHHIEINPKPYNPIYAALFVTPSQLDQQLAYLSSNNYHTINLDELFSALNAGMPLPSNPVILTFDDGYQSFYDNAFPLLKKYHMKAVQFVITQVEENPAYLTWDEIVKLDKSGLVEIAAHTRHHPDLTYLSQDAITDEIKGSKNDLQEHLKHPINWFAYPYGSYNDFIVQAVKKAGFKGAVSTIYGTGQSKNNQFIFSRIMVDGRFSLDNIAKRIQE